MLIGELYIISGMSFISLDDYGVSGYIQLDY